MDKNKTRREAANEMANDFMAGLFSSEKGLNEFIDWVTDAKTANEQVTILQKIKDMFDSFLKYIKDFFANGKFNAAETAALDMAEDRAEALRQKIIKALDRLLKIGMHNLGADIMKQIPAAMEDPEMILRLDNGRINAILKIVDKKGRTILISLEMDKGKYIDKKYAKFKNPEQAVLVTAFGAKPKYIEKLIKEGEILYPIEKASSDVHEGSQRANPSIKDAILNNSVAPSTDNSIDKMSKNSEKTVNTAQERKSIAVGDIEQQAIEHFGTTDSFRVAGYMLQDGTLLDFSGAHWLEGENPAYIEKWKSQNDIR